MGRPKGSLSTSQARAMAEARDKPSGGRKGRKKGAYAPGKPRCACGAMTAKRAAARAHRCGIT
jgi:hypothetical protein